MSFISTYHQLTAICAVVAVNEWVITLLSSLSLSHLFSIPHRDLCWFQPLTSETLTILGFQGTFPTDTSNDRSLVVKMQVEIAETLALSRPTLP